MARQMVYDCDEARVGRRTRRRRREGEKQETDWLDTERRDRTKEQRREMIYRLLNQSGKPQTNQHPTKVKGGNDRGTTWSSPSPPNRPPSRWARTPKLPRWPFMWGG